MEVIIIIGERIKAVRKSFKISQRQFAERIGIAQNTIASYETGLREPSNQVVLAICREFGADEAWLRTGEGEMLAPKTRAEALGELSYRLTAKGLRSDFVMRLMEEIDSMTDDELVLFERVVRRLAGIRDQG